MPKCHSNGLRLGFQRYPINVSERIDSVMGLIRIIS